MTTAILIVVWCLLTITAYAVGRLHGWRAGERQRWLEREHAIGVADHYYKESQRLVGEAKDCEEWVRSKN